MSQATVELIRAEAIRMGLWLEGQPAALRMMTAAIARDEYVHFLTQSYHYIRHTTPFLRRAASRLRAQRRYPKIATLMEQQAQDKDGHDRWLLEDLAALGFTEEAIQSAPVSPAIAAYVTWNQFTVQDGSPLALLGTAYVLGLLSTQHAADFVRRLISANVIPNIERAVRFLSGHRDLDPNNVQKIERAITLVTGPADCDAIYDSARTTRAQYVGIFASSVKEFLPQLLVTPGSTSRKLELQPDWVRVLTRREQEVTSRVLGGAENKDIANELGCRTETVRTHLRNVRQKLGVSSKIELVALHLRYLEDKVTPTKIKA